MNKTAIQKFAVWARGELLAQVKQRAYNYGVTAGGCADADADAVGGRALTAREQALRRELVDAVQSRGYDAVAEEAAYTWFNRFAALRYMEVNDYLPTHVRVFSNAAGAFEPEILREALHLDLPGLDRARVAGYIERNESEALYRYLLLTQCNALGEALPQLFEPIAGYTALLCPGNLLRPDSVPARMVADIPEADWTDQVQIIGWLYQYYISEKHEEVVDPLHGKVVAREDIPAATQLFTTDWVVRYMVDNSLGRYWLERHPESALAARLAYLVTPKNGPLPTVAETLAPEDLTILDPCVGSGHILVYAFEVLMEIYKECGYAERDAAQAIVQHNLYGLDIDKRAAQLACFAVMMQGRKYDRRFLQRGLTPQIYCPDGYDARFPAGYEDGKEYGSLILVDAPEPQPRPGEATLETAAENAENTWNFRRLLAQKYAVVCTNPPYLNKYNTKLKDFVNAQYKDYAGDLFSVYIYRDLLLCRPGGYCGYMTPFVWMFIKTYEKLRQVIIREKSIATLIQMEYSAFEEATVPICAFVLKNGPETAKGLYFKLSAFKGGMDVQRQKVLEAMADEDCGYFYETSAQNFTKIPGTPVAYWVSRNFIESFSKGIGIDAISDYTGSQNKTANNDLYLRKFWEVDSHKVGIGRRWVFYAKGGNYRKYYGNLELVIDWSDSARNYYLNNPTSNLLAERYWYQEGITYTMLTSKGPNFRYLPPYCVFDMGGPAICRLNENLNYVLAFLNTVVTKFYLELFNPTINLQAKDIKAIPLIFEQDYFNSVSQTAHKCVMISMNDWDSYETSWDFKKHPLI